MEVRDQRSVSAAARWWAGSGPEAGLNAVGKKKSLVLLGTTPQFSGVPGCSVVTTPTKSHRLLK
jgi:hypothetical protein